VTVALNGDGGDESFSGYRRYAPRAARLGWLPAPLRRVLPHVAAALGPGRSSMDVRARAQRFARQVAMSDVERYAYWMAAFNDSWQPWGLTDELRSALPGDWTAGQYLADAWRTSNAEASVDRMMDVDIHTYLPGDLLVKMDIASMASSVEARSPFLDHALMEFAAALPVRFKRRGQDGKLVLKSAMEGLVPGEILRRPKMGFGVPLSHWFRDELRHLPEEVLGDPSARIRRWIRPEVVRSMIAEHHARRADHSLRLWVLLQLEHWHREVLESPVSDVAEATVEPAEVAVEW
jgi:asparagine synthase (glutamine-hydrolysing)